MIVDKCRDIKELEKLCQNPKLQKAEWIFNNPHHYCFYEGDKLLGVIYFNEENDKLFLSGAAQRKIHDKVLLALETLCNSYDCDIYSETTEKPAIFALKKVGFKKIKNDIYRRLNNG